MNILLYRLKWQALQAVHLFIEHVMMDHVNFINKTVQFLNRIRMVGIFYINTNVYTILYCSLLMILKISQEKKH